MKTSTKVIIKFQIFTTLILFFSLAFINTTFLKIGISQYNEKIQKIIYSPAYKIGIHHGGRFRNWQEVRNNCFQMYNQNFCLTNNIGFGIYKQNTYFFYSKNGIVINITEFITFYKHLLKLSIGIILSYIILSYFLGKLFLNSIYKKIFQATKELTEKNFINLKEMNLEKNDELYILFNTINKQIESISSFNKYLSHELKTPLMNISSTIDLLKLKENNPIYDKIKENIQQIKSIIDCLNKLLLIENKKFKLEKTDFNICEEIKKFNINLKLKCKTTTIKTNKDLFKIVLSNLLNNAKKYSNGVIKIIVDKNFLEISNPSKRIKNINKLTEKFYKESNKGMGIGLYLTKKIVDILGYKLEISQDKNGIFKIKIIF